MSTDKKNDHEDLDLDFASFDIDPPPGGGSSEPEPFDFEAMPGPATATKPGRAAPSPRDHFGDIDGTGFGEDDHDAHGHGAAGGADLGDFGRDEFGIPDDEPVAPVAPARAARPIALHKDEVRPASRAHADEDSDFAADDGFGGMDDHGDADNDHDGNDRHAVHASDEGEEGDEVQEGDQDAENDNERGFDPKKYLFHAVAAVAALFVGIMGWNFIGGMISGSEQVRAGGPLAQIEAPERPRRDSGNSASNPLPAQSAQSTLPPMPPVATRLPASGSQALPGAGLPALGMPNPPASTTNTAPPMAGAVAMRPDPALSARIEQLEARLHQFESQPSVSDLQQKVRLLEDRLTANETRSVPAAPRPENAVPLKPQLIAGYSLQGYFKGLAWIQGPDGSTIEAREGTDLGTAGVVTGVQRYAKDFVVVTTVGVIMRN